VFVVLPDTHALCGKDAIGWEDLKTEHFILTRSEVGMAIHDYVIQRLRRFISVQTFARVRWRATRSFTWWGSERGSVS
jgi:hypothetical protein